MIRAETLSLCLCLAGAGSGPCGEVDASGAAYNLPQALPRLEISFRLEPARAASFLSYREKGIGQVRISNRGAAEVPGLALEVELPDRPDLLPEPFSEDLAAIAAGGEKTVQARPRFAPSILREPAGEVRLRATLRGSQGEVFRRETLLAVIDRAAVTWDVPERLAALIDPLSVSEAVRAAMVSAPAADHLPLRNLRLAAQAFDVLAARGLRYLRDFPGGAAGALLGAPADRVSLPAETWSQRAGDCDDLSVLLAAALESAGVPCAIAVLSDHVFVLFDLETGADGVEASGLDLEGILEWSGRRWIPLESTRLTDHAPTLLAAWNGARHRLPGLRSGEGRVFGVREAWAAYPPIAAMSGQTVPPGSPGPAASGASERELARALRATIGESADRARARAPAGYPAGADRFAAAVFAAAGYRDEAEKCLRRALDRSGDASLRLEIASLLLASRAGSVELEAARRELEAVLEGVDPLDLEARSGALKGLETVYRLRGDRVAADRARSQEALLFGEGGPPAAATTSGQAVLTSSEPDGRATFAFAFSQEIGVRR